jgi:hypothetical protein
MALQTLSPGGNNNASTTTFRAWGSALSAAVGAAGCVQTADTGQINWASVTVPGAGSTSAGYEVWRFNDTLQSTAPIYFKLEYGSSAVTAAGGLWLTVGTGSDGAGNISNASNAALTAPRTQLNTNGVSSVTYVNGSAADSTLAVFYAPTFTGTSSAGGLILIERSRGFDGTPNSDGCLVVNCHAPAAGGLPGLCACFPLSFLPNNFAPSGTNSVRAWSPGLSFGGGASLQVGGVLYLQPLFTHFNVRLGGPSKYVLGVTPTDLGGGSTVSVPHYGSTHSWLAAGYGNIAYPSLWGQWMGTCNSFLYRMD